MPRVVAMSGCPGSGDWPVFAGGAWLPDMEGLWARQWPQIAAYWEELSAWAPPGVDMCLELHPGTSIYNAASFALLAEVTGANVKVNLDPSHFWWQGIDPVATVRALAGRIGFAHGKDTLVHADRVALHGVLDFRWPSGAEEMPWHFCAVGRGRGIGEWRELFAALGAAGYAGPVSIEHEDPTLDARGGHRGLARGPARGAGERGDGLMEVRYEAVSKSFGTTEALAPLDITVPDGRFLAMLGPSGCGKTTALRLLAGLETPTAGRIFIGERDVTRLEPRHRDIAMVFQSYALYPHKTVADNIAYPLRLRRSAKAERDERVRKRGRPARHRRAARSRARASSRAASASGSRWRGRSSAARRRS